MIIPGFIGGGEIVTALILLSAILLIPVTALVDILKNEFEGNNKLIWVIVVIFLSGVGALLYFIIGVNQKISNRNLK